MSYTTTLHDQNGQEIGYLIHNSDYSGDAVLHINESVGGVPTEIVLPGSIILAIQRQALGLWRERAEELLAPWFSTRRVEE